MAPYDPTPAYQKQASPADDPVDNSYLQDQTAAKERSKAGFTSDRYWSIENKAAYSVPKQNAIYPYTATNLYQEAVHCNPEPAKVPATENPIAEDQENTFQTA